MLLLSLLRFECQSDHASGLAFAPTCFLRGTSRWCRSHDGILKDTLLSYMLHWGFLLETAFVTEMLNQAQCMLFEDKTLLFEANRVHEAVGLHVWFG
jgi:hypothetical protein